MTPLVSTHSCLARLMPQWQIDCANAHWQESNYIVALIEAVPGLGALVALVDRAFFRVKESTALEIEEVDRFKKRMPQPRVMVHAELQRAVIEHIGRSFFRQPDPPILQILQRPKLLNIPEALLVSILAFITPRELLLSAHTCQAFKRVYPQILPELFRSISSAYLQSALLWIQKFGWEVNQMSWKDLFDRLAPRLETFSFQPWHFRGTWKIQAIAGIDDRGLQEIFSSTFFEHVRSLTVDASTQETPPPSLMRVITSCASLTEFDFTSSFYWHDAAFLAATQQLGALQKLQKLSLAQFKLTPETCAILCKLPSLQEVRFSVVWFKPEILAHLLENSQALKTLHLRVEKDDVSVWAQTIARSGKSLTHLHLEEGRRTASYSRDDLMSIVQGCIDLVHFSFLYEYTYRRVLRPDDPIVRGRAAFAQELEAMKVGLHVEAGYCPGETY